jgi:hypothetical protein
MKFNYLSIVPFLLALAASKPCDLVPTRPVSCDLDKWHQERKVLLGLNRPVDVRCYSLGRNVQGNQRWLYVEDKEC